MRSSAFAMVALVACNTGFEEPVQGPPNATPATPVVVEKAPIGVPHGGQITRVAVTERADAAVTVDNLEGLRLWPALDGSREPVPFTVNGADAIAITHSGDELLVGVVDQAGAGHLVRFSRAGAERGTVQLPGYVAIEQIVAIESGMLVVRSDQSIERYDSSGTLRGRIGADPSTSFGTLAVRHGIAAVMLVARETTDPTPSTKQKRPRPPVVVTERASSLRWITLDEGLAWGPTLAVPNNIDPYALAISPSHTRELLAEQSGQLDLFDVGATTLTKVVADGVVNATAGAIGLVDDDHAVGGVNTTVNWLIARTARKPEADPWKIDTSPGQVFVNDQVFAVGDGMFVSALGPNLIEQDLHGTRYLGWSDVAAGNIVVAGLDIGIEPRSERIVWLDRDLQREKELDATTLGYPPSRHVWWIDPDHAVFERQNGGVTDAVLVDLRHHEVSLPLGSFRYIQQVTYSEDLGMLAIFVANDIHRFRVDLEHDKATELPMLVGGIQAQQFRLVDPTRAGGMVAVAAGYDDVGERVMTWRDEPGPTIHGRKSKRRLTGVPIGIDPSGLVFVRNAVVTGVRDSKEVVHFSAASISDLLVSNSAGDRLASIHGAELAVYDDKGEVEWRHSVWGAQAMLFTRDGTRLVVRTTGGLLMLDATTGERLSAACGFTFGIMTKPPAATALNTRPVCEDLGT